MKLLTALVFSIVFVRAAPADSCRAPLPEDGATFGGAVSSIIDGDGLCIGEALGGIEVRLGDFDAPELGSPEGEKAKAALARIALGRVVQCHACEGAHRRCRSYDRIIATCRLDGRMLGDLMRAAGIAEGGR